MNKISFKVRIQCMTYNQASYITDAMKGFTMQQTDFPFVCTIIDDASTDGEQNVIKKYLRDNFDLENESVVRNEETDDYILCFAQHKTNKNCFFAVLWLKYNHCGIKKSKAMYYSDWENNVKYVALCEGDDYWTDPLKLQKQFDYMESHPGCVLCTHAHYDDKEGTLTASHRYDHDVDDCPLEDIMRIGGGFVATNSMMFKAALMKQELPEWYKISTVGDIVLMYWLKMHGEVAYINTIMSAYRIASEGSWTQRMGNNWKKRNHFFRKAIEMHTEFDCWSEGRYHTIVSAKIKHIKELKRNENISQIKRWILKLLNR